MNILFRCDGSLKIGLGHVVRCLALADHLNEKYTCNIQFAMRESEIGIKMVRDSYTVIESNETKFFYQNWLLDCINRTNSDIFIMDMRDGLTQKDLKTIKKKTGVKVVTIDDPEDKRLDADLAFYPPVPQVDILKWDGFKGELFTGWEYVILRDEFLKNYPKPNNNCPTILISMGGTDEKNMTEFVIKALSQIDENFKVIIIIGKGYPYLKTLKNQLKLVQFEYELHQNPKNIAKVMSSSDFAIISFGQTAYELAALQIPSMYYCLTKDHDESAQLFVKNGFGKSLGLSQNINRLRKYVGDWVYNVFENDRQNNSSNLAFDLNNLSYQIVRIKK